MSHRGKICALASLLALSWLNSPCLGQLTRLTQGNDDSSSRSSDLKGRYIAFVNDEGAGTDHVFHFVR